MPKSATILFILLAIVLIIALFYAGRYFYFNRFAASLIENMESSTGLGVKIENISYVPLKGLRLRGVSLYKSGLYKDELLSVPRLYMKIPLIKLLVAKTFAPTVTISDLKTQGMSLSGLFGMEMKTNVEIASPQDSLKAIKNIRFYNFSAKSAFLNMENLNGSIGISPDSIKSSPINFVLNGEPCKLNFEITDPLGELSSEIALSSSKINVNSTVKKEGDIYKISKLEGTAFNSSFKFTGELSGVHAGGEGPALSLYGDANIDTKDIVRLASPDLKKSFEYFKPEGVLANSVYFKAGAKNLPGWELGIKSSANSLKIGDITLTGLRMASRIEDGVINITSLNAYLYGGTLVSSAIFDLKDESVPYWVTCALNNLDIWAILQHTNLKGKDIKGVFSSKFTVQGEAKKLETMRGPGRIVVTNANLGPMPLLSPLLGHAYGYLQHVFPELKRVDITGGSADFYIKERRLTTDNLVLAGDAIAIYARGYIDFDKNLDFDVSNKILQDASSGEGDWQASFQQIIVQFGKLMSRARLTGTLENPKWKFEYFGGVENIFKGGLDKILKGIFE